MKRILSLILAVVLCVGCVHCWAEGYTCSSWAEEYIKEAAGLSWVDISCDFTKEITREEFCIVTQKLMRDLGEMSAFDFEVAPFEDTGEEAVLYLYGLGIIKGKVEGIFAPDDYLTREEAAVIMGRVCALFDVKTDIMIDMAYADDEEISDWAKSDVYNMATLNIMQGTDKGFEPKRNLTKEQSVTMLLRLYDMCQVTEAMSFADKLNAQMPMDKNYMFSPLSIKMALGLAANGAEGETQEEILEALGYESVDELNNLSKNLIDKYSASDKIRFDAANSIWINKSNTTQEFSEEYKTLVNKFYNAEAKTVTNSDAVSEINDWVKEKTNGKIAGVIDNNNFWAMLVNAIYFKGMWEDDFYKGATKKDEFTNADGTKGEIDFMNKTDWIYYADTGESEIITLPYKTSFYYLDENGEEVIERNRDLSAKMYVIVPDGEVDVESEINKAKDSYKYTYMNLALPKFEVEYRAQMSNALKEIGINKAFSQDAEFEKMFNEGSMSLTDIIHKTYIKVDEEGTEAAAVTAIAMAGNSMPPEPVEFKVNKPFYFAVTVDDEILFMGRYAYAE